jgi:hypothetical protein
MHMRVVDCLPRSEAGIYANGESVRLEASQQPFAYFGHECPDSGLFLPIQFVDAGDVFARD